MSVQELAVSESYKILNVSESITVPEEILTLFAVAHTEAKSRNDKNRIKNAKNIINQYLISEQMREKRFFNVVSPFWNSCVACKGFGEILKFDKKPVEVNCHICAGKSTVKVKCNKCDGSGRYIVKFKEGGGFNLKCKFCHGTGKVKVTCRNCRGKGKIKKIVLAHTIKSTTPCEVCGGLGFIPNVEKYKEKPKRKKFTPPLRNPVISPEYAKTLSQMIKTSKAEGAQVEHE
jgi:hypothetical protein